MHLLHQMARAYLHHRITSPPPGRSPFGDRRPMTEEPAPFRWMRDLGFDPLRRSDDHGVRASDADRELVVSFLKRHSAEGRLSIDELTSRVEAAYTAVSLAHLERLTGDLPGSPFAPEAPPVRRASLTGPVAHVAAIAVGLLVLVALASMLAPPEVWASLLILFAPLGALALISILPFALPVLGLFLLARGTRRPMALPRGHERHSLLTPGRRGSVHVWRF